MKQVLIICGPTAAGKTRLAFKLAKHFKGVLISADSRQVYRGMDIGTGKDRPRDNSRILGYDLVKPDQEFSLAHFVKFARQAIQTISAEGKLAIVVGGTGLYLRGLTEDLTTVNIPPDLRLRRRLEKKTLSQLQAQLKKLNLERWQAMTQSDRANPRRLIRAIEISLQGLSPKVSPLELDVLWIGLTAPLKYLDRLIETRVKQRVQAGAQKELARLLAQGYSWDLPAFSALGYRQWRPFFSGQASLAAVVKAWQRAEKQYARRQLTWFRKNRQIHWFDVSGNYYPQVVKLIRTWYTKF
jgi:tRNA dimethylallyltransferase